MTNALHEHLAARILTHIKASGLEEGYHLTETSLQDRFATSRGPVRGALTLLARRGVLAREPNRGFFVKDWDARGGEDAGDDRVYLALAHDRLAGRLPETLSENEAMRRYDLSRAGVRRIFDRMAKEGWIERREGRGWSFLPVVDSVEAYRENYEFRQMLEPAGLRAATFRFDDEAAKILREQQEFVREDGWRSYGQTALVETNARFHEGLAQMSGNRFLIQAIERQNQMRRLVEYRQRFDRERVRRQVHEHLGILDTLAGGDRDGAAELLSRHLERAKNAKAVAEAFGR